MTRAVRWGGLPNAWDLGGLPRRRDLPGPGSTLPGRLVRSGRLDALDAVGWGELVEAGVTTIVDLRNDSEVRDLDLRPASLVVHRMPVEDETDEEFVAEWGGRLNTAAYYPVATTRWPALFRSVFEAIADAPGLTVIHCSAGRDRTGLVSALLLDSAGVERAAVVDDYVAAVRSTNAWLHTHPAPHERALDDATLAARIPVLTGLLEEFLDGEAHAHLRPELSRAAARLVT